MTIPWSVIIVSLFIGLASPPYWRRVLERVGAFDVPNHRSSHSQPVLRGGGVAPLTSVLVGGIALIYIFFGENRLITAAILFTSVLVSIVGLIDDITELSIKVRAVAQIIIGLIFSAILASFVEAHWAWVPLAAVFFAANVNFTNFMDGINGISSLHGLTVGLLFALIGSYQNQLWLTSLGLLVAAAYITFLPWNFAPPGMFLGDVGSYLLGGLTGSLVIATILAGTNPIVAFAPLSIYWIDTVSTLVRRAISGKPIFDAHRMHIYQQLTDHQLSHLSSSLIVAIFTGIAGIAGIASASGKLSTVLFSIVGLSVLGTIYLQLPQIICKRKERTK